MIEKHSKQKSNPAKAYRKSKFLMILSNQGASPFVNFPSIKIQYILNPKYEVPPINSAIFIIIVWHFDHRANTNIILKYPAKLNNSKGFKKIRIEQNQLNQAQLMYYLQKAMTPIDCATIVNKTLSNEKQSLNITFHSLQSSRLPRKKRTILRIIVGKQIPTSLNLKSQRNMYRFYVPKSIVASIVYRYQHLCCCNLLIFFLFIYLRAFLLQQNALSSNIFMCSMFRTYYFC